MKSVAKSQFGAQKDAKSEKSQTAMYKSQAADGCQQCKKIENEYIECQKKLERSQRQLSKANDYNEDLRKQIDWLSSELHNYRKKAKKKAYVGIQTEDAALPMGNNSIWKEEWKNYAEINDKDENDESVSEKNLSIVEEIKQAAEEAVQGTGYVYDETTGLYYDRNSGYYYDAETALHYDSHTGTYYTYDSYSRTYNFHSQVDPSYLQQSQGETNYPDQSDQNSFKDYRDPAARATANSSTASSKSSKKRKNKTKKEKTTKVLKIDDSEKKSDSLENLNCKNSKHQESHSEKGELHMDEDGEISTEVDERFKCEAASDDLGMNVTQMEFDENVKLNNHFQIDESELQGLNRKQRREKIRLLKKKFEEKLTQNDSKTCEVPQNDGISSETDEKYDQVCSSLNSGQESEVIETGFSMYGCDELCSTSDSSVVMEETSVHSSVIVSDSSGTTITSTYNLQTNTIQDFISTALGNENVKREDLQSQAGDHEGCVPNPVSKNCDKTGDKVHVTCKVQEETLYQGNLSDDTQNAVDYDFVTKVKHENGDVRYTPDANSDIGKDPQGHKIVDQKDLQSMSCDLNQSVDDESSTVIDSSHVDSYLTSSEFTIKSSKVDDMESLSLNLVQTSDKTSECQDSEDSGSLCTDESELESGELTDSSDESEESLEEDEPILEGEEPLEDQDPHCLPPCIRIIVLDSDHLDYGSLFIITVDGGTIGREKNQGNLIVIPDINISKVHAQFQYSPDSGQYNLKDFGSQNGTFLNEQRISESKCSSATVPVKHGDMVQVGCTRLLLHIHPGIETCQDCEPGIVQAAFQAKQIKSIPILSKEEKKKQARQELNQIKKKYGLKNAAYEENSAIKNPNYQDRADERRKTKGSDNPYQVDEAPASVHRPITKGNVGHKMLKKMGWSEGESLGKDNTGIQNPVTVDFRANQKAGLGSVEACSTSLDDIGSAKKNQRWLQAQQRYRKAEVNKQLPTPAWVKEDS